MSNNEPNPAIENSMIEIEPALASVSIVQDVGTRSSGIRVLKSDIPELIQLLAAELLKDAQR